MNREGNDYTLERVSERVSQHTVCQSAAWKQIEARLKTIAWCANFGRHKAEHKRSRYQTPKQKGCCWHSQYSWSLTANKVVSEMCKCLHAYRRLPVLMHLQTALTPNVRDPIKTSRSCSQGSQPITSSW